MLLNVPLTLLALLSLLGLWCLVRWIRRLQTAQALAHLTRQYQLASWTPRRLVSSAPPLVDISAVVAGKSSERNVAYAIQVELVFPDPELDEERAAVHLHRRHTESLWQQPIGGESTPALSHETRLGGGLDDEWMLFTRDEQMPVRFDERVPRNLIGLVGMRRLDLVPSRYRGEPPGKLFLVFQLSADSAELDAETVVRLLEACHRHFRLNPCPGPGSPRLPGSEFDFAMRAVLGGLLLGLGMALLTLSIPATTELWGLLLCAPGDSLKWVSSHGNDNVVCSQDSWRLVLMPVLLICWSVVAWLWTGLFSIRRMLRRGRRGQRNGG
jgi:hypothetical protein